MNFSSDNRLPRVSHHASTRLSKHWITYTDGSAIQHLHYLPFGEEQIDQRLTSFNSRYTFSAKEKDIETNYSYFGARYYNSDLSIWLSVDPLSDKYPSLSPYNYCANNPVKLIDPNGMDIELTFYRGSNGENSQNEFTKTVNGGLGGQFEAYYSKGKNGGYLLNLKATEGGGDVSKMSPESKAFYNELKGMIDDHNTTSEVNVKCGSSKVVIGDFTKSTIDIGDINQFDNMRKGAATKQGKLIHELSEQFGKAKGMSYNSAHQKGINAENRVNASTRGKESYQRGYMRQEYMKNGSTTIYNFNTSNPIIRVTKSY